MNRLALAVVVLLSPVSFASASVLAPKPDDVCLPTSSGGSELTRAKLVSYLFEKSLKLSYLDFDDSGDTNYDRKVAAILDWDYCKTHICKPDALEKLPLTRTRLEGFLVAISRPNTMGYTVMGPGLGPQSLRDFLEGPDGNWRIACIEKGPQAVPSVAAEGSPRQYFAIRKNVDDFKYSQKDPEFKKVERASLAFKEDYVADNQTFGIDGLAGYTFGPAPIGEFARFRLTPFVSYKQDYADAAGTAQDKRIFNIGGGAVADLYLLSGHDFQIYPKYVHSVSTEADTLITSLVYTPTPFWPYIASAGIVVPHLLWAQFTPQLKAAQGVVYDAGTDTSLEDGNYFRWGPRIAVALYGEGWLKAFLFNASYETYQVSNAKITSIERFEASIDYTIGEKELWALQLKYVSGQDLDTWEDQNQVTLGAGLKY